MCILQTPNEEQAQRLVKGFSLGKQSFNVVVGREYVVFGLSILGGAPWVQVLSDFGYLYHVPLCLFEITDGRLSKFWEVRYWPDGDLTMWPPSFYREFYHDDLIERVPEVVEDFRKVRIAIESEAQAPNRVEDF